jgi:Tol biopolymer transport system component
MATVLRLQRPSPFCHSACPGGPWERSRPVPACRGGICGAPFGRTHSKRAGIACSPLYPAETHKGLTSVGIDVFEPNLSPDGKQLIFMARRAGKWDLMTISLPDRREVPLLPDDDFPYDPLWSPDSKRLAYVRWKYSTKTSQVMMCSTESRNQNPVTDVLDGFVSLYEWSVNGDQLVLSMKNAGTGRRELWLLPKAAPHAQVAAQKLLSDPDGSTHQGHISPDGQWIVFEVVRVPSTGATSTLYAMRTAGGPLDSPYGWPAVGRQATLVPRRKDHLLSLGPPRVF